MINDNTFVMFAVSGVDLLAVDYDRFPDGGSILIRCMIK